MAREINRDLFASTASANREGVTSTPAPIAYAKAEDLRALHLNLESVSRRMKEFESRVELMHTKVEDLIVQNRQRGERTQAQLKGQAEMLQNALNDSNSKMAQVVSRLNERKISEGAVKEMIDRHGQVVQTFEVRLQQVQKVMSEQELQLMHARSELKQALQELARLKKF